MGAEVTPLRHDEQLRQLRAHLQLSQRELAQEFKVTPGAVALWESGARKVPGPVQKLLEVYAEELGLDSRRTAEPSALVTFPTSRLGRSWGFSLAAGDVAMEWLKSSLLQVVASDTHASRIRTRAYSAMAVKLAKRLADMKGLGTKIFQTLNYFSFLLPPEARTAFSRFERVSSPLSQKKVAEIFLGEFGRTPKGVFASWTAKPRVTASIGQVHQARLSTGEHVAVKVQYPQIAEAIRADLRNIAILEKWIAYLLPQQKMEVILGEMLHRFQDECDYRKEADYQERFRTWYAGRPEILIPRVHRELSTERVLVSELVRGRSFRDFVRYASPLEKRDAAQVICRFAYESILRFGHFHADPHPGNYLFLPDGRVAVLDFGCVTDFDPAFVEKFRRWLRALLDNDAEAHRRLLIEFGIAPASGPYDFDHHFRVARQVYRPMLVDEETVFSSEELTRAWRAYFMESPNRTRFHHSKEWVFMIRLNWGLTFLLASLGARANWRRILEELLAAPAPKRPKGAARLH